MHYRDILIIFKQGNMAARKLAAAVHAWLNSRGALSSVTEASHGNNFPQGKFDCVIVLGGDGTILGTARKLACKSIPIFGINSGNVGFLAAAEIHNWPERLTLALNDAIIPRKCAALKWRLIHKNKKFEDGYAINDVVISRGALARLINLYIKIDRHDMGILRSDSLIISSPPGSSGYSASAGGPIVYPDINCLCLTAVCPFPKNIAPLVLPVETELEISLASEDVHITWDGQEGQALQAGDIAQVSGMPEAIHIWGDAINFYEKLQKRGFALSSHQGCKKS